TIKSEYESGKQYVDLLLKRRPPISPNYTFALELKYLKKAEMARLEAVTAAGEAQLRQYLQQEELRQMPDLRAWLIVFVGTEAKVLKEINR
ncbi:MAG: AAA family ATPase, partial [Bacteroidetes bacterium]